MNGFKVLIGLAAFMLLVFTTGCSEQQALTVADVIQNADRLDGKNHPGARASVSLGGSISNTDVDVWWLHSEDRS
jgi:hypothetical protein